MSDGRGERSVAVYASGRSGNVASDEMDPLEMWRGWTDIGLAVGPAAPGDVMRLVVRGLAGARA